MSMWCIPGAPLEKGAGWRIWYANPGLGDFKPKQVTVQTGDRRTVAVKPMQTRLLEPVLGFARRIALGDVILEEPRPGLPFNVNIPELNRSFRWQTRPDRVGETGTSLIFASCFWQNDDGGYYKKTIDEVVRRESPRPAFKLLVGDQIYLDWPLSLNPLASPKSVTGERYRQYWGDATYRALLLSTPNFFTCDDHEYWNDYPEKQKHLARSKGGDRDDYAGLADAYYQAFQVELNAEPKRWYQFDLAPASFFVTDTRSGRDFFDDAGRSHFMSPEQWDDLRRWQQNLTGPGFLVLGQPLFQEDGDWKDHSLSNFRVDYGRLIDIIERSLAGDNREGRRHDIVILSGDIHTGRHSWAAVPRRSDRGGGRAAGSPREPDWTVHEFIASPASRVGPFVKDPKPSLPPATIPPNPDVGRVPWKVRLQRARSPQFPTVDNNIGVLRLFPAERMPYRLRVQFRSYLVRPHRRATWKILSRALSSFSNRTRQPCLYETELNLL